MSIRDEPLLDEEFVYLDDEAAEFGLQEIDPAEDVDAFPRDEPGYPEELPEYFFGADGELLPGEEGDLDERR